jgi:hypothetical protein
MRFSAASAAAAADGDYDDVDEYLTTMLSRFVPVWPDAFAI